MPTPIARRTDRSTSWEAANSISKTATEALRADIYKTLRRMYVSHQDGLTSEELLIDIGGYTRVSPSGVRTRLAELYDAGWVTELRNAESVVVKRPGLSGRQMTVWRAVLDGEDHKAPAPKAEREVLTQAADDGEHRMRLAAARRFAEWNIGDASWADGIVSAYLNPVEANARLDGEGAPA